MSTLRPDRAAEAAQAESTRKCRMGSFWKGALIVLSTSVVVAAVFVFLWWNSGAGAEAKRQFKNYYDAKHLGDWRNMISCLSNRRCQEEAVELRLRIRSGSSVWNYDDDPSKLSPREFLLKYHSQFDSEGVARKDGKPVIFDLTRRFGQEYSGKDFKVTRTEMNCDGTKCTLTFQHPELREGVLRYAIMVKEDGCWRIDDYADYGSATAAAEPVAPLPIVSPQPGR